MRDLESLFDRHAQETRLLRLTTPLGRHCLLAECAAGNEAISTAFSFTITAWSLDTGVPLKGLLGQPALLELALPGRSVRRPFHGYLTGVHFDGADGGMMRYTLTLEPWTMFLSRRRNSRVFQNVTVPDVLDAVFAPYHQQRGLGAAWRFDLLDASVYPARSLIIQSQESDLGFAERLMREAGLFYFFQHEGDRTHRLLGRHDMVIADHNGAFKAGRQEPVTYTRPGAALADNGIHLWHGHDAPEYDAHATGLDGEPIARRHLEERHSWPEVYRGEGAARSLASGTTFSLLGYPQHDQERGATAGRFLVTRVRHAMRNCPDAGERAVLTSRFKQSAAERVIDPPMYRNRLEAVRADLAVPAQPGVRTGQVAASLASPDGAAERHGDWASGRSDPCRFRPSHPDQVSLATQSAQA